MAEIDSTHEDPTSQQASAWFAVVGALEKASPGWMDRKGSGKECAVAAIDDMAARIAELEHFKTAFMEWHDKTDWLQKDIKPKELGMHRADVLRERIAQLEAQVQGLRDDAERNKVDAECFRWWVHEAAANPCLVATAIAKCVTEDEYRKVICGAMSAKDEAIYAARAATKGGAA